MRDAKGWMPDSRIRAPNIAHRVSRVKKHHFLSFKTQPIYKDKLRIEYGMLITILPATPPLQ